MKIIQIVLKYNITHKHMQIEIGSTEYSASSIVYTRMHTYRLCKFCIAAYNAYA